jgi:hypothetical protein
MPMPFQFHPLIVAVVVMEPVGFFEFCAVPLIALALSVGLLLILTVWREPCFRFMEREDRFSKWIGYRRERFASVEKLVRSKALVWFTIALVTINVLLLAASFFLFQRQAMREPHQYRRDKAGRP